MKVGILHHRLLGPGLDCNGNDSGVWSTRAIEEHEFVWHLQFVFLWLVGFINEKLTK